MTLVSNILNVFKIFKHKKVFEKASVKKRKLLVACVINKLKGKKGVTILQSLVHISVVTGNKQLVVKGAASGIAAVTTMPILMATIINHDGARIVTI